MGSADLIGAQDTNGVNGPASNTTNVTTVTSANGRTVVSSQGSQVGILYLISASDWFFLPTVTTNPKISELKQ